MQEKCRKFATLVPYQVSSISSQSYYSSLLSKCTTSKHIRIPSRLNPGKTDAVNNDSTLDSRKGMVSLKRVNSTQYIKREDNRSIISFINTL
jgi:hypothetical protein